MVELFLVEVVDLLERRVSEMRDASRCHTKRYGNVIAKQQSVISASAGKDLQGVPPVFKPHRTNMKDSGGSVR